MPNETQNLATLIEADRKLLVAREAFFKQGDAKGRMKALTAEVRKALSEGNTPDACVRLMLLTDVLAEASGGEAIKLLLEILGHEEPGVRVAAGESLVEALSHRWSEGAKVVDGALANMAPEALRELPFVLIETGELGVVALLSKLLAHKDGDTAAAAIEAFVEIGDRSQLEAIRKLVGDKRPLTVEDQDDEGEEATGGTVGDVAAEAVEVLSS
jgi:HEAT repeat protein